MSTREERGTSRSTRFGALFPCYTRLEDCVLTRLSKRIDKSPI